MPISETDQRYWDVSSDNHLTRLEVNHYNALRQTVLNIFKVRYGDAGGIFRPDYGSLIQLWLHEPQTPNVADAIRITVAEDLRRNRSILLAHPGQVQVTTLLSSPPGYRIRIILNSEEYQNLGSLEFDVFI